MTAELLWSGDAPIELLRSVVETAAHTREAERRLQEGWALGVVLAVVCVEGGERGGSC